MTTLVCNAAEGCVDTVIGRGAAIVAARQWDAPTSGTEILAPGLDILLRECGLAPADIKRIACVCGPGSFTGIRLILATAAALRRVLHIPLAGLNFMQALAIRAGQTYLEAKRVGVVTHARRNLVHYQVFSCGPGKALPESCAPVELVSPDKAAQRLLDDDTNVIIGSALSRHTVFASVPVTACTDIRPHAQDLWTLAQAAVYNHADIEPLYVRPCDAIENLDTLTRHTVERLCQTSPCTL